MEADMGSLQEGEHFIFKNYAKSLPYDFFRFLKRPKNRLTEFSAVSA
jgi:hypothetical protein